MIKNFFNLVLFILIFSNFNFVFSQSVPEDNLQKAIAFCKSGKKNLRLGIKYQKKKNYNKATEIYANAVKDLFEVIKICQGVLQTVPKDSPQYVKSFFLNRDANYFLGVAYYYGGLVSFKIKDTEDAKQNYELSKYYLEMAIKYGSKKAEVKLKKFFAKKEENKK